MRACSGLAGVGGVAGLLCATAWLAAGRPTQAVPKLFIAVRGREAARSSAVCFSCFWLVWLAWFLACLNRIRLCCAPSDRRKRKVGEWSDLFPQIL